MTPRDHLIGALMHRITRADGGDAAAVLEPQALHQARDLAASAAADDVEAVFALGTLYLVRHRL